MLSPHQIEHLLRRLLKLQLAVVTGQYERGCIASRRDTQTVKHHSERQENVHAKVS
jgi:hypothetical protein